MGIAVKGKVDMDLLTENHCMFDCITTVRTVESLTIYIHHLCAYSDWMQRHAIDDSHLHRSNETTVLRIERSKSWIYRNFCTCLKHVSL
jgi:hypothetical protein